jgi:uncharacterized protein YjbI with pentapeptide repeats
VGDDDVLEAVLEGGERWQIFRQNGSIANLKTVELSETDLSSRNLADIDLSGVDLFRTNLQHANLKKSDLNGAELTEANLQSAAMYKCNLRGAVLQEADLSSADLTECDCTGADFRGANLRHSNLTASKLCDADFTSADLTGAKLCDADITSANFRAANFSETDLTRVKFGGFRRMAGKYYGIRGIEQSFGNAVFVREAKDEDYIETVYQNICAMPDGIIKKIDLALFWAWGLIDNGRSLLKVGIYAALISTLYGLIYTLDLSLGWGLMDYSNSAGTWFTPFYYSLVTYTTLGFGDVTADSLIGEMLVISEVIAGYFTLGMLLAILANTVARRS